MYKPVQQCTHCGAGLSLDDLRKPNCTYCGTVYPHQAMAAQHAQVVNQVMGNMMQQQAQVQDQWRGAFGVQPLGGPVLPPQLPGAPGNPYAAPHQMAQVHFDHAAKLSKSIALIVMVVVLGSFVLVGAIVAFALFR